ncbi:MAG: DUF2812 domain-containing protein [Anaerolineales bacterium]|nr:DUF2812 domain-containing protein [Anaerolineales bacterium]
METDTCWKFRWFWAWQDDHEEEWLGSLSREGWHLSELGVPGVYYFRKGEPMRYAYRMDFQTSRMQDREAYLQLFRDAGWEHVGKMSAWEYFRKEAKPGEEPEIFTDPESKILKYRRVLWFLVIFFPILFILFSTSWRHLPERGEIGVALLCIAVGLLLLYVFGMLGILRRIGTLKQTIRK